MKNKKKLKYFHLVFLVLLCFLIGHLTVSNVITGNNGLSLPLANADDDEGSAPEGDPQSHEPAPSSSSSAKSASNKSAATPIPGNPYKNQEKIPGYDQTDSFMEYMEQIIGFSYAVIGILAMFMLMIGAYQYLMAAGNLAKVDSAKQIIASALLGLGLGLISFLILNTINPDLVSLKGINLEGLNVKLEKLGGGSSSSGVSSNAVSGSVPATEQAKIEKYDQLVKDAAQKHNVDPNLIRAVIKQESNWNPLVIGRKDPRDKGMMQINEKYHKGFFANNDWRDPQANINYGTQYLAENLRKNGNDPIKALATYNAGNPNSSTGQAYAQTVMKIYYNYKKAGLS